MSELLSAYTNNEVSTTQREFVEEHLVTCLKCRDELVEYRQIRQQLVSLREFASPAGAGEIEMTTITNTTVHRRTSFKLARPLAAAGALVIVFALVVTALLTRGGQSGIASAYDALAALESFRVSGTTTTTQGKNSFQAVFDWSFNGNGDASGSLTGPFGTTQFVLLNGTLYSTNSAASVILDDSLLSPVPTREGTLNFLKSLTGVTELGTAEVNGVSTTGYSGKIDLAPLFDEPLASLAPGTDEYDRPKAFADIQKQSEISVEAWIGKGDSRLQKLVIDARIASAYAHDDVVELGGWLTYKTVADYSGFNEQPEIVAPVDAAGMLQPGWSSVSSSNGAPPPVITLE